MPEESTPSVATAPRPRAERRSRSATWAWVSSGWADRTRAATPDVCGAAIDVPERTAEPLPVPTAVERMLTPGAVTSGFRLLSPYRGPPDVKSAGAR